MKLCNFRAEEAEILAWKEYAESRKMSFARFCRDALNEALVGMGASPLPPMRNDDLAGVMRTMVDSISPKVNYDKPLDAVAPTEAKHDFRPDKKSKSSSVTHSKSAVSTACPHRVPLGSFCKRCGDG